MKFLIKVYILLFLAPVCAFAQGRSFIKTFTPKEYDAHAQNWCMIQDNSGFIYFGNTIGLLIFDGKKWQSLKLNNSAVRSLSKNKNDVIYYGAQDEFGYLIADEQGNITGKSLVHLLPDSLKNFGDVWKTYCYESKVIFQTFDFIFIYENEKINVVEPENFFHFGYQRNNDFYIIDREIGLKRLNENKLNQLVGGDFFANLRVYGWINYSNYAIAVTREKGLIKIMFKNNDEIEVLPIQTDIDSKLLEAEIYYATSLSNGNIAIGTLSSGLYILNNQFRLVQYFDKNNGLKNDIIKFCYEDMQQALWLALDVGIARIEINSKFQFINEGEGLEGIVNSIVKFNETKYIGTTKGLFKFSQNKIQRVNNFNNDVRYLLVHRDQNKEFLYLLTEIGTFKMDENQKIEKINDENGFFIGKSILKNNIFYIGSDEGISIFYPDLALLEKNEKLVIGQTRKIVEENDSTLWAGTTHNGVYKITIQHHNNYQVEYFDTSKGLPSNTNNLPFKVNKSIYFGTLKGIYHYSQKLKRFVPSTDIANAAYDKNDQIYQIIEGFNNKVWLFKSNDKLHEFIWYDTKTKNVRYPLRRMGEYDAYQCIFPENENVTWFGGPDGLFRYDASMASYDTLSYYTKIRAVYCNNDTLYGGYWGFDEKGKKIYTQPPIAVPEMVYQNNNINFEFAALSFDNEKENVYSYYLEGFDNQWSDWTSESKKSYTNLNEGTYTFHIKSKNVYGKEGEEDTYTFTILPPWYRTGWAYFAYVICSIVLVYFITQISVRRLKRAKERLEAIVINRTAEVVAEKEEVEKQKKIVEVKNKDITDSINYAQRIQQAILPLPEDFSKVFPESFIYFQPRDIVSGDFYWFNQPKKTERNWVYLAVADCTGHGVPGAFMSMIGNTLLNEILNEKQIYETDQILNHLHIEVRAALKQDTAQNTTNDGMDIALCRIDLDTFELQYSGANRALYIFKNTDNESEFIDIKPNKFPIGGYQAETTRSFTPHLFQLKQKDTFYIFSDGYADQFGGVSNKKFMVKRLQNELMAMQNLSLNEQKYLVQKLVMDWKGEAEQVDDILMIGVRL